MLTRIETRNYRAFGNSKLDGLRRINVITGANGSGKTALLEAVYLAAFGHPMAVLAMNAARGVNDASTTVVAGGGPFAAIGLQFAPDSFRSAWLSLLNDPADSMSLKTRDRTPEGTATDRELIVSSEGSQMQLPPTGGSAIPASLFSPTISFQRKLNDKEVLSISAALDAEGRMGVNQPLTKFGPECLYFPGNHTHSEADNIKWLSQLRFAGGGKSVVDAIRREFPFIHDLEVWAPNGTPGIFAKLDDNHLRPLPLVSSGIYRLTSLVLGLATQRNGIVLIDEIENGIFYDRYQSVWRTLIDLAIENENQIFVTSHSLECLEALVPTLDQHHDQFLLLRTERRDGRCAITKISSRAMEAALKGAVDIRGGGAAD